MSEERTLLYFAYGTLQEGLPNYAQLAHVIGRSLGRFHTVEPHALVIPLEAGCANPGCNLLHRMVALVAGMAATASAEFHAEGDLYAIDRDGLAAIDRLESFVEGGDGPYVRETVEVAPVAGGEPRAAFAYRAAVPGAWLNLAAAGRAELRERYTSDLAGSTLKACCRRDPAHDGPHDVIDPLRL